MFDDQFLGEQAQILDGLKPTGIASRLFVQLIFEIIVKDVAVGDAEQIAHKLPPRNVGTARMETRMRLGTNEAESDQSENVIRISGVTDGATENSPSLRDAVMFDIIERVAIGETFESKAGKKVQ